MRRVLSQFGLTGWLALTVLVLVPLLAVLQYRWLGQVSEAERERMQRTLATAAEQLAVDLDNELTQALTGLQIDATTLERRAWDVVAQRHDAWAASAVTPGLVERLHLVDITSGTAADPLALLAWNSDRRAFEDAAWTGPLAAVRPALEASARQMAAGSERLAAGRQGIDWQMPAHVLLSPVVRVSPPVPRGDRLGPPDVTLLGFTVLTLDLDVLSRELLPALVRRHLYEPDGTRAYRIAVVERDDPARLVFESEPGAAAAVRARHDVMVDLLPARPAGFLVAARSGPALSAGSPPGGEPPGRVAPPVSERIIVHLRDARPGEDGDAAVQARLLASREGHWRLLVAHQAGSLEAAVTAARQRNLFLSSGILVLLTVAIGLIIGSARRAHALARQQMEFVAAVTHELRTPVAVINSAAGNLADGLVEDPARVKTYGATIRTEARRLGETVERVLQFGRLEAGAGTPVRAAIGPAALVRETVEACQAEIVRLDADVAIDAAPDLPEMEGDPAALRSAVQNLLENALKYGGAQPSVRIRAAADADARRPQPREVIISVEDRGPGIAAEDRPHLFEPFYRGREALRRRIPGSGLGLSLVARIVQAHGGRVTLESAPGRGSTFTLHLPASAPSMPRGASAGGPAATPELASGRRSPVPESR